jgi:hypothetical protein
VNVRETDGKAAEIKNNGRDGKPVSFVVANALDETEGESRTSMQLKPFENVFIRVSK